MSKKDRTPALVIATLGRNDVQVVLSTANGESKLRYSLHRGSLRDFQEDCYKGEIEFGFVQLSHELPIESRALELRYDRKTQRLYTALTDDRAAEKEYAEWDRSEGKVQLCMPLMAKFAKAYESACRKQPINHILILTTRRENRADEPAYAFELMKPVLADHFEVSEDQISECVLITSDDDIYERNADGEVFLRYELARRIDASLKTLLDPAEKTAVVVNDIGGIPEVKTLLSSILSYRAPRSVVFIRSIDSSSPPASDRKIPPQLSFDTRRLCRELCQQGAVSAAAQVAKQAFRGRGGIKSEPWSLGIASLNRVLQGECNLTDDLQAWPEESSLRTVCSDIEQGGLLCLIAFRVELALQGDDLMTGLRETARFIENARNETLRKSYGKAKKEFFKKSGWPIETHFTDSGWQRVQDWFDSSAGWIFPQEELLWKMVEALDDTLVRRELINLYQLYSVELVPATDGETLRDLRNRVAHAGIHHRDLLAAAKFARDQQLWMNGKLKFMNSPRVQSLFSQQNSENAEELFVRMLDAVSEDMDRYSLL